MDDKLMILLIKRKEYILSNSIGIKHIVKKMDKSLLFLTLMWKSKIGNSLLSSDHPVVERKHF